MGEGGLDHTQNVTGGRTSITVYLMEDLGTPRITAKCMEIKLGILVVREPPPRTDREVFLDTVGVRNARRLSELAATGGDRLYVEAYRIVTSLGPSVFTSNVKWVIPDIFGNLQKTLSVADYVLKRIDVGRPCVVAHQVDKITEAIRFAKDRGIGVCVPSFILTLSNGQIRCHNHPILCVPHIRRAIRLGHEHGVWIHVLGPGLRIAREVLHVARGVGIEVSLDSSSYRRGPVRRRRGQNIMPATAEEARERAWEWLMALLRRL